MTTVLTFLLMFQIWFAGVISWISVIYLDVVKSRIQADDPTNPRYRSMIDCFRQCYAEGGARSVSHIQAFSLRFRLRGLHFLLMLCCCLGYLPSGELGPDSIKKIISGQNSSHLSS